MAQAAGSIQDPCEGRTLEAYRAGPMLRSALERRFEITGEALRQAMDRAPSLAEQIGGGARIIAFRNRLIHGDASASDELVWGVVESNLPELRDDVARLMGDGEEGAGGVSP